MAGMEGQPDEQERLQKGRHKARELSNEDARVWSEARPWPVRALTLLLGIQGAAVLAFGLWGFYGWVPLTQMLATPETAFFVPLPALGILGLLATLGFLSLRPGAWVIAMLVQGLCLTVTLVFYFLYAQRTFHLFAMMFYAVVMVLYLNYAEVPAVFRSYPDEEADRD